MIPPAYPCVASRYVEKVIKTCEWVKNEKLALNLLCIAGRKLYPLLKNLTPSTVFEEDI